MVTISSKRSAKTGARSGKAILVGTEVSLRKKSAQGIGGKVKKMTGAGHKRNFVVQWANGMETTETSRSLVVGHQGANDNASSISSSSDESESESSDESDTPDTQR